MILSAPRTALLDALSIASTPVDSDPAQPILSSLRLTATASGLEILGTDLLTTAVSRVPVTDVTPGACAANARTLADRVKLMPEGTVRLRLDGPVGVGSTLTIEGGSRRMAMSVRSVEEFPRVDARAAAGESVSVAVLSALLDRGATAMSPDKGAQPFKRVSAIRTVDGWTEISSASSGECAYTAVETGLADFPEIMIPYRGVEILRRFVGGKGTVTIEMRDGVIYITRDAHSLCVRAADPTIAPSAGYFASWTFPFRDHADSLVARTITVHRLMARETIAAISSASEMGQVEVTAASGRMRVSGRSDQGERAEDEVICSVDGDAGSGEVKVILSGETVAKVLGLAASERVSIRIAENNGEVVIKEIGELEARAFWLTMPIMPTAYAGRESAQKAPRKSKAATKTKETPAEPDEEHDNA